MTSSGQAKRGSWFQRYLLPGFALKAVIIGGGYATGRELAEFFVPAGPWGGLLAMGLAMLIWSLVAAISFALAHHWQALDYRSFFQKLLGPAWPLFEIAYLIFVVLILAVFGAAAGAIGAATFGWPPVAGTVLLAAAILLATAPGEAAVEALFRYASFLIYATYIIFILIAFFRLGGRIETGLATQPAVLPGWIGGGVTYAAYNIVGAVVVLPVLRHLGNRREALIAGAIAGPLAMLPALLFFTAMLAFYPAIGAAALPSEVLLNAIALPWLGLLFQVMIFAALWESGVGAVHAINERIAGALVTRGRAAPGLGGRVLSGGVILTGCMLVAVEVGLVDLIAQGYRFLAWLFLAVYLVPLLTIGVYRLLTTRPSPKLEALP
ncbi:hypothetical protein [Sandarakinorhabdus sp.]|jgi:uncharacterized membrane protein YkvI|uniref:YkvI family membrane protein n=1 Tax=Sandarakinorhabdus sp. TaxID=1916663 RepID=UPI0028A94471|nr:hypothetical protein [Sandarakinorhabdus sp.]